MRGKRLDETDTRWEEDRGDGKKGVGRGGGEKRVRKTPGGANLVSRQRNSPGRRRS